MGVMRSAFSSSMGGHACAEQPVAAGLRCARSAGFAEYRMAGRCAGRSLESQTTGQYTAEPLPRDRHIKRKPPQKLKRQKVPSKRKRQKPPSKLKRHLSLRGAERRSNPLPDERASARQAGDCFVAPRLAMTSRSSNSTHSENALRQVRVCPMGPPCGAALTVDQEVRAFAWSSIAGGSQMRVTCQPPSVKFIRSLIGSLCPGV